MKIKILPILLVFIFIIVFLVFYKGLQTSSIYTPNLNIKKNVPSFKTYVLGTQDRISSAQIFDSDEFYLMNIWASWCLPCREEHIFLMNLSKNKNIIIIGLNYKDKFINAKNFINELGNPYSVSLDDKDGVISIDWGAYGVPESFLIHNNKVIKKYIGPINKEKFEEIKEIIK